ncbi:MAG: hypothetical protein LBQ08_04900 [Holosporaceae bacterium]|nr:hypothetical protein [Holosporaceae bacterium]
MNKDSLSYDWYISADQIFSGDTQGFEKFSKFFGMEFQISRFSLLDGNKISDSAVLAQDVKIYIGPGSHCAMIQGRLANGVVIPKIIIKKITSLMKKLEVIETKEFFQCVIQSFALVGENISFTFRYSSYSDSYTDFSEDGTNLGTAATKIDLAKWKVEDS